MKRYSIAVRCWLFSSAFVVVVVFFGMTNSLYTVQMIFQLAVWSFVSSTSWAPQKYTKPNKTTLNFFSDNLAHAVQKPRMWLMMCLGYIMSLTHNGNHLQNIHTRDYLYIYICRCLAYIFRSNAYIRWYTYTIFTATTQKILMSLREIPFIFENNTKVLGVFLLFFLNLYRLCLFALQRNDCALSFTRGKIVAYI